ncbi:MAG TPA: hypothetical protein VGJ39_10920, partial [Vicinamibacterales bacterium]
THVLSASEAAPSPQLNGCLVFAILHLGGLIDFPGPDPHHVNRITYDIARAFLTFRTLGHMLSAKHNTALEG